MKIKYFLMALSLSLFSQLGNAQSWFDLGLKGIGNTGILFNQNILDDMSYDYKPAKGFGGGAKIGFHFEETHSVTLDVMYHSFTQNLRFENTERSISFTTLDIPFFYRHNAESGQYSEIGPYYSITKSSSAMYEGVAVNTENRLVENNLGIMAGFGQYVAAGNIVGLTMGVRLAYQFQDLIPASDHADSGSLIYTKTNTIESYNYKPTNPFYIGILMELNFDFGYFVSSACGKKTKFLLFGS